MKKQSTSGITLMLAGSLALAGLTWAASAPANAESSAFTFKRCWSDAYRYAVLPKEYLAESIIKSHTVVAAPGYAVKEGRAAMGEYNHFLTVQEVIMAAILQQGEMQLNIRLF